MFGFIAKMPKLALIGLVVLLIGFSPEILMAADIDTVGPNVTYTYPNGTYASPTPMSIGTLTLELHSNSADFNWTTAYCMVTPEGRVADRVDLSTLVDSGPPTAKVSGTYMINYATRHTFEFWAADFGGDQANYTHVITYGEVGDADGEFWMKDGNDPDYRLVTKDATERFNHRKLYFKFVSSSAKHGSDITKVWIDVVDESVFYLSETVTDTEWNGSTWTAPSDGTYKILGKFEAFNRPFTGMSILVGSGEEPVPPGAGWTTYDWLKILGAGLIVVGLIWKK